MRHILKLNGIAPSSEPLPRLVIADFVKVGKFKTFCYSRKFMRHILKLNVIALSSEPLPRLVIADFVKICKFKTFFYRGIYETYLKTECHSSQF